MARSVGELLSEAKNLDERDRARLAGMLLESLEHEQDADVERTWTKEVERRVEQIDAGEVELVPWAAVKKRLLT